MRRTLTHLVALAGLAYAVRAWQSTHGWERVPSVDAPHVPATEPSDTGRELALARATHAFPMLSVIVPARNEERNIEACVRSLARQRGVTLEIIVVDDRSTDATRAILERLAAEFPQLRVVDGMELPDGWVGKPWACAQGALQARAPWLVFTDADSIHAPTAAASTLAYVRAKGVDALTLATGQIMDSLAERVFLPGILGTIVFACGPITAINDPAKPRQALANGQFILVSRVAYDALGGHEALRAEMVEDLAFARLLKRDGRFRLLLAEGSRLVRVRMYHSLGEIWAGFTKNAYLGANGDLRAIGAGVGFMGAVSIAPPLLAIAALRAGEPAEAAEAAAVTVAVVASAWRGLPCVGLSRGLAFFAPMGLSMFAAIALNSTRRALFGRGFTWRGRTYGDSTSAFPGST
jgi:chlorobactene glucosyltransferase